MTPEPIAIALKRPTNEPNSIVTLAVTVNGHSYTLTLDTNLPTQRYIYEIGKAGHPYEPESTVAIANELKPGDVFFDVGANCGWFSALASAMGAHVYAFEPTEQNMAALKRNAPKAWTFRAVVTDFDGTADLYVNFDNDGGHALWDCGLHPFNTRTRMAMRKPRKVRAMTLDTVAVYRPTVIKIDTEGAECNVLLGGEKVLANPSLRMVVCERHLMGLQLMGHSPEEIEAIMSRHGFRWEKRDSQTEVENWIFRR